MAPAVGLLVRSIRDLAPRKVQSPSPPAMSSTSSSPAGRSNTSIAGAVCKTYQTENLVIDRPVIHTSARKGCDTATNGMSRRTISCRIKNTAKGQTEFFHKVAAILQQSSSSDSEDSELEREQPLSELEQEQPLISALTKVNTKAHKRSPRPHEGLVASSTPQGSRLDSTEQKQACVSTSMGERSRSVSPMPPLAASRATSASPITSPLPPFPPDPRLGGSADSLCASSRSTSPASSSPPSPRHARAPSSRRDTGVPYYHASSLPALLARPLSRIKSPAAIKYAAEDFVSSKRGHLGWLQFEKRSFGAGKGLSRADRCAALAIVVEADGHIKRSVIACRALHLWRLQVRQQQLMWYQKRLLTVQQQHQSPKSQKINRGKFEKIVFMASQRRERLVKSSWLTWLHTYQKERARGRDLEVKLRANAFVAWARGTGSERERERDLEMRCEYATTLTRFSKLAPVFLAWREVLDARNPSDAPFYFITPSKENLHAYATGHDARDTSDAPFYFI